MENVAFNAQLPYPLVFVERVREMPIFSLTGLERAEKESLRTDCETRPQTGGMLLAMTNQQYLIVY